MPDEQDWEIRVKLTVNLKSAGDWEYFLSVLQSVGFREQFSSWAPHEALWAEDAHCSASILLLCILHLPLLPGQCWSLESRMIHNQFFPPCLVSMQASPWITGLVCVFRGMQSLERQRMGSELAAEVCLFGFDKFRFSFASLNLPFESLWIPNLNSSCLNFRQADFESDPCGFGLGLYPQLKGALI